jgi:hypothetical protein
VRDIVWSLHSCREQETWLEEALKTHRALDVRLEAREGGKSYILPV